MRFKLKNHEILIDKKTLPFFKMFKWRVMTCKTNKYVRTSPPRFMRTNKIILLHHLVFYWVYGYRRMPNRQIDHIDGNGLNNQIANLRAATHSQNHANSKKTRGTSKFKGVYLNKNTGQWHSQITYKKKTYYLGKFDDEHNAALAYNVAALKKHKQFSKLNIIEIK